LKIAHQVVQAGESFEREVVSPCVADYLAGFTPNPCARCNAQVKFPLLWQAAAEAGADYLATGHYCDLVQGTSGLLLAEARDRSKSQAYFLARISPALLGKLRFPLSGLSKSQVRRLASEAGLRAAEKAESQDGCFLPDGGWAELIEEFGGGRPGRFEDSNGQVMGNHGGVHLFTVGQRRGLGLALGQPVYVLSLDGKNGSVTVGPEEKLWVRGLRAREAMWYVPGPDDDEYQVRVRYAHRGSRCQVRTEDDGLVVEFAEPQRAVAPGQLAVFSRSGLIMGSAWIHAAIHDEED
jgi:tRNA-specific 2-thiouridylase